MKTARNYIAALTLAALTVTTFGQTTSPNGVWTRLDTMPSAKGKRPWVQPQVYKAFQLDPQVLQQELASAQRISARDASAPDAQLEVPKPDGSFEMFRVVEAPVMAPELAAKFPDIKTYTGESLSRPGTLIRLDFTPKGFHAQVTAPDGMYYVDPFYRDDISLYSSYRKMDYKPADKNFRCYVENTVIKTDTEGTYASRNPLQRTSAGDSLRTYRLAIAAQGEYTQFHGGTVAGAMAAIVTTVNRVTGIYERDMAIRLVLVGNNDQIVYTNAGSDPYSGNDSSGQILDQNQSNLDSVIGSSNYDVGHVFNTGGGGLAGLGVVCQNNSKAEGSTGSSQPQGDPFDVDFVAHELGHQFGAEHSFNGTQGSCSGGNRNGPTAYEPGSASSIMGYAGICDNDDLQNNSDPYFHFSSITQILGFVSGGGSCSANSGTGNTTPTVEAGANHTIPHSTPFVLRAVGNDGNGDSLTYSWEEKDLGPAQALSAADNGSSPLFRTWPPTASPDRYLPRLDRIISGSSSNDEKLPNQSRTMTWRVVVRDNRLNGGGINMDDRTITVNGSAGPFRVTAPNSSTTCAGTRTVTWNVANTSGGAVNTPNVNIKLSTDGGNTYPYVLATNVPNDGSHSVILPNINSSTARILVEGNGNIFFDISDANFTVVPGGPVTNQPPTVNAGPDLNVAWPINTAQMNASYSDDGFSPPGQTNLSWTKQSGPGTVSFSPNASVEDPVATFSTTGSYVLVFSGNDGLFSDSDTITVNVASNTLLDIAQAVDKTDTAWTSGGSGSNWFPQTSTTHDGTDAAQAPPIGNGGNTWVETTVTGPGTLSFWWQVSSEDGWDFLSFAIDGTTNQSITGTSGGWQQINTSIGSGSHTLRWSYHKDDECCTEGDDTAYLDEVTFTPDAPPASFDLDVTVSGNGSLNVSDGSHASGTVVNITATPQAGHVFSGWSGDASGSANPLAVTMDEDKNITATFTPAPAVNFNLDVTVSGSGSLNVSDGSHPSGTVINITATPQAGHTFSGWSGDASGSANPLSVTMDDDKNITATFTPDGGGGSDLQEALDNYSLAFSSGGNGSNWTLQTHTTHDSNDAAQSSRITHGDESYIETTVTGPGTLSFWWNVGSEEDWDFLSFVIDGVTNSKISGNTSWQQITENIPAGVHTLRWTFERDDECCGDYGNAGRVDQVVWTPEGIPNDTNYLPAVSHTVLAGSAITVTFDATNTPDWVQFTSDINNWPASQVSPVTGNTWTDTNPPPASIYETRTIRFIKTE